jgi:predicted nucleic acid-binding protein
LVPRLRGGAATFRCNQADDLGLSVICVPEIISALNRRLREQALSSYDYRKASLAADIRDSDLVNLLPAVISSCMVILGANPLLAMDALHVACALEWKAELFVSSDKRQITSAKKAGLRCKLV